MRTQPLHLAVTALLLAACSSDSPADRTPVAGASAGTRALAGAPSGVGAGTGGTASAGSGGMSVTTLPADDAGIDPNMGCARAEHEATLRPLDMLVLLDQSGSMTEHDDRWTPVTSAIKRFVNASESAGLGIGLQYFPLAGDDEEKCQAATYAMPPVPLAALPGNASAIVQSIDAHHFTKENCCDASEHEGTPTRPAMEGVIQYLSSWLTTHPERNAVILLATDGEPSSICDDNQIEDVAQAIAQAAQATPAIKTYVIGIGKAEKLSELAEAGGTGAAAFVLDGTGAMTEVQLLETLATIRGAALSCDFAVPTGMDSDTSAINVQRGSGSEPPATLVRVPKPEDCAKARAGGWHFDASGARIELCPETCSQVIADPRSKVKIVVGCAAVLL